MATSEDHGQLVTPNVSYKSLRGSLGYYRMHKLGLNNQTGNQVTLDATAQQALQVKLAGLVNQPAKMVISYNIEIPAQGAGRFIRTFESSGLEAISSISLEAQNGTDLMRLQHASTYASLVMPWAPVDDYLSRGPEQGCYPGGLRADNGFPVSYDAEAGNIYRVPVGATLEAATDDEPRYYRQGGDDEAVMVSRKFECEV